MLETRHVPCGIDTEMEVWSVSQSPLVDRVGSKASRFALQIFRLDGSIWVECLFLSPPLTKT